MKNLNEYDFKALDANELLEVQGGGFFRNVLGAVGGAIDSAVDVAIELVKIIVTPPSPCPK